MLERGLIPDFSTTALAELEKIQAPAALNGEPTRDLRGFLWASINNDDSRDMDQLTVAEAMPGDKVKILVAVADVDALVKNWSVIDEHARHNTTSIYTATRIFPILPDKLSTDLTSLNFGEECLSIVVEMVIDSDGTLQDSDIYRARVTNHAKLAYNGGTDYCRSACAGSGGFAESHIDLIRARMWYRHFLIVPMTRTVSC